MSEIKKSRPKNVIRRETQEKLKQLYQLFCKIIDEKDDCYILDDKTKDYINLKDPKPDD